MTEIHALFRPNGTYRHATKDVLWFDGGRTAVRRFFESLRTSQHAAVEQHAIRANSQAGGKFSPREPHYSLAASAPTQIELIEVRMDHSGNVGDMVTKCDPALFTGCGVLAERHELAAVTESDTFQIDIPGVRYTELATFVMLREPLMRLLGDLSQVRLDQFPRLDKPLPREWHDMHASPRCALRVVDAHCGDTALDPLDIIKWTLQRMNEPEKPFDGNLPEYRCGWWTSMALSRALGVAREDDGLHHFKRKITLKNPSPTLAAAGQAMPTWCICVIAPPLL